ncbi:hypothetical protein [Natronogracilivirga saccharolytica]|uniref:Uncharacterized protein n=1 Tax=Natronogracilivirga saccharolytica TaxID=2812953 RepID=A0A8J7UTE6_9BACT|nr:hypothetical protein [Natronogracilivirga saccharolytica]MBP3192531.1 hypothetical protein [Natronogracilivirga saccharolytica]
MRNYPGSVSPGSVIDHTPLPGDRHDVAGFLLRRRIAGFIGIIVQPAECLRCDATVTEENFPFGHGITNRIDLFRQFVFDIHLI